MSGQDAKPRVLTSEGARVRGLPRSDAALLGVPAATWVPIYYESIDAVTETVGHQPLRREDLPDGQQEVRVWVGFGITGPMEYLRLRATQEQVRGELYLWWSTRYGSGPVDFVREHFACEPVQQGVAAGACRARYSAAPEWGQLLDLMEEHQVWSLPDASTLPGEVQMLDGTGVLVEVRDGQRYRAYLYSNPSHQPWPEAKHADAIMGVVGGVSSLSRIK